MKDDGADGVGNVGRNEVHCTVCGELIGSFSGRFSGETRCKRCKRDLRFQMQDGKIVLECDCKKN